MYETINDLTDMLRGKYTTMSGSTATLGDILKSSRRSEKFLNAESGRLGISKGELKRRIKLSKQK